MFDNALSLYVVDLFLREQSRPFHLCLRGRLGSRLGGSCSCNPFAENTDVRSSSLVLNLQTVGCADCHRNQGGPWEGLFGPSEVPYYPLEVPFGP